jgi:hypothetical protein
MPLADVCEQGSERRACPTMQKPLQLDYQPGMGDSKTNGFMNGEVSHKQHLVG